MLESGKMVDAVSNMPGGVKTAMTNPDDIKYFKPVELYT
jgi:hypothetical protein